MLVLSRKVGEKILIGDNIAVTIVRVAQGTVRLGVEAPRDLSIVREEIQDQLSESVGTQPTIGKQPATEKQAATGKQAAT